MPHVIRLPVAGAALAVGALTLSSLASATAALGATAAVATIPRAAIAGPRHPWVVTANQVARALTTGSVDARVYLAGRDQAALTAYATAVSSPGNALYRHYLTPAQANARFGATRRQLSALRSWLTSVGLRVTGVQDKGPAGAYIAVHGSLPTVSTAFAVTFARYRGPGGHTYRAPRQPPSLPKRLASSVLSITGLDTAGHLAAPQLTAASGAPGAAAPPCSSHFGQRVAVRKPTAYGTHQPWRICHGYIPRQVRSVYGVAGSGMTGQGQTVAIVDPYNSPTIRSDASTYARRTGDPVFRSGQYERYQVGRFGGAKECGGRASYYAEQALDVESLHGMAPGANIRFVAAASCKQWDMASALAFIVNRHLASIVSDSWGWPAQDVALQATFKSIFQLGATEGIGFFFSSGDNGYDSPAQNPASAHTQVEFPTSSPWVTSVGGTSLAIGRHNTYQFETSWGTLADLLARNGKRWRHPPPGPYPAGYNRSGGGGVSTVDQQPSYQRGVVPARLATKLPDGSVSSAPMRVIPDVSAVANPFTGLLVGQTTRQPNGRYAYGLFESGGTSLACPVFAGIEADAQQGAGYPLGFANPAIYARYGTTAFHDVTDHPLGPGYPSQVANGYSSPHRITSVLLALGIDGKGAAALRAVRGYDAATGVGSPAGYIQSFTAARP